MRPRPSARAAMPIWLEGAYEARFWSRTSPVPARRSCGYRFGACRGRPPGLTPDLRGAGLSPEHRKPAAEGHRRRQEWPAAHHPRGGQPFLDHRRFGRQRLSRPIAGRAEGEAALDPDQSIRRTTARKNRGGD